MHIVIYAPILMNGCVVCTISKTVTKETGGKKNMDTRENATNLMDCKEIKQSRVQEAGTTG